MRSLTVAAGVLALCGLTFTPSSAGANDGTHARYWSRFHGGGRPLGDLPRLWCGGIQGYMITVMGSYDLVVRRGLRCTRFWEQSNCLSLTWPVFTPGQVVRRCRAPFPGILAHLFASSLLVSTPPAG